MPVALNAHGEAWLSGLVAFLGMLLFTPLVIRLARAMNWLAVPKADRWHRQETALMGGIALYAAATLAVVLAASDAMPWTIWLGATLMFVTGLVDDLKAIRPVAKLAAQVVAAGLLLMSGHAFGEGWPVWVSVPLTFFWVIGITNAVNLLDNMDGLAAGTTAIAAFMLALFSGFFSDPAGISASMALAGAAAGFLVFNFKPARIFMGDSGSLFLGYTLACLAVLIQSQPGASGRFAVYLASIAVLAVPIFDTTLVTLVRKLSGRAVSQGGRDHSSHRLVFLGFSERGAVLVLYAVSVLFGAGALLFQFAEIQLFLVLLLLMVVALIGFGVFLAGVDVYAHEPAGKARGRMPGRVILKGLRLLLGQNWKASFGLVADLLLVLAAFVLAHYLRDDGTLTDAHEAFLLRALPVVAGLKILTFYGSGLYRGIWRHAGSPELVRFVGATTLASALVYAVLALDNGTGRLTLAVACIDWMITTLFLAGIRFGYRGLHQYVASLRHGGDRVLLYGAGHAGQLMLRDLRQNRALNLKAIGFIDDDPLKRGLNAQGLSVLGTQADLEALCVRLDVRKVLIAAPRMTEARMADIHRRCAALGVECRVFRVGLHPYVPGGPPAPLEDSFPLVAHQE